MSPPARRVSKACAPEQPHAVARLHRSQLRFNTMPPAAPLALGRRSPKTATVDGAGGPPGSTRGGSDAPEARQNAVGDTPQLRPRAEVDSRRVGGPHVAPARGDAAGRLTSSNTRSSTRSSPTPGKDAPLSATLPTRLWPKKGDDRSAPMGASLSRVVSMPQLPHDRGQQTAPRPERSPNTPASLVIIPPRRSERLPSSKGLPRVSTRSEAEASAPSSKEPPERRSAGASERLPPPAGLLRVTARSEAEGPAPSTREPPEVRAPQAPESPPSSRGLPRAGASTEAEDSAEGQPKDRLPSGILLQAQALRSSRPESEAEEAMAEICRLHGKLLIPTESMKAAVELFREHATVPEGGVVLEDGKLSKSNLASVMRKMILDKDEVIEGCLVDEAFTIIDKDNTGSISFYEFAIWFSSQGSFNTYFLVDAKEQRLRKLSKQVNMPVSEIDTYKRHFDSFDTDGNGMMDRTEFYDMLLKCLKVPKNIGLPAGRVQSLWAAADSDGSGEIDFSEFIVFFSKYFPYFGSSGVHQHFPQNGLLHAIHRNHEDW